MMKVRVKDKYLNVRVGKPSINAPCYQYIAPGSEIEIDGKLYKGDKYGDSNIDTWFKDESGNYYWSGGVNSIFSNTEEFNSDFQALIDSSYDGQKLKNSIDYNKLLQVDQNLKLSQGQNVTIGIVDHPMSLALTAISKIERPFHTNDPLFNFHSNFIAGLITGTKEIIGVANRCSLIELPIYNARATSSGIDIEGVLNFINNYNDPLIINISNALEARYNEIIKKFKKDKIVVACAGIDEELISPIVRDPASQENVIAVGAIGKRPSLLKGINKKIDFVVPNYNYVSFGRSNNEFAKQQGDSFACAIVSGIIALLISSGRVNYDLPSIKQELTKISTPSSNDASFNSFNIINIKS